MKNDAREEQGVETQQNEQTQTTSLSTGSGRPIGPLTPAQR